MKFQRFLFTCVCLLRGAVTGQADSTAYVVLTNAPGSATPFNIATGRLGAARFVPPAGIQVSQPPGKHELWELIRPTTENALYAISILNPKSLASIANIPLDFYPTSLTFDPAGKFAYVSGIANLQTSDGELLQIDVASRATVRSVELGGNQFSDGYEMAFSADGSTLFLPTESLEVLAIGTASLAVAGEIPIPSSVGSLLVSGTTLLIPSGGELLYIDTNTLLQTKNASVTPNSSILGMSADRSKIYLYCYYSNGSQPITVIDFGSGSTLLSQAYPQADLVNVVLSPDATRIVIGSSPLLLIDSANLATLQTIPSVGIASSAVFLDSDNVLLLNAPTDAMVSIDQSTKEITSIFPIGLTPASAPVADPQRSVLYSGGYEFNDGTTNVISTTVNRIVDNLPAYSGFAPALATATQLYGDYNGEPVTYSFAQKSTTALPYPLPVNPNYYTFASPGTGPPNGRTYWVPFQILPNIVDDGAGASFPSGIAVYNTATNALVGRMLFDFPPGPLAFSPDSATAYVVRPGLISVIDAQTLQTITTFHYAIRFDGLVVSPNGLVLYAHHDAALYVLDARTGVQENLFPLPAAEGESLSIAADGNTLFLTDPLNSAVDLIDTGTGAVSAVSVPYSPAAIAVVTEPVTKPVTNP